MGIYIPNMEMPKRGHTVTITIVGSGEAYVEYYDCRPPVEGIIEYKAIPVPPHGRLIDADALKESIHSTDTDEQKILSTRDLHHALIGWINNRPTIIEAEEGET